MWGEKCQYLLGKMFDFVLTNRKTYVKIGNRFEQERTLFVQKRVAASVCRPDTAAELKEDDRWKKRSMLRM